MQQIKVWDPFVRVFHWSLVGLMIGSLVTAEDFRRVHVNIGVIIIFLVVSRVVWGFIGTGHARFSDFTYPPSEIFGYLKGLFTRKPKHYVGHNPAGGAMVIALLITLLITTFAGLKAYGEHGHGPFAGGGIAVVQTAFADEDEHEHEGGHGEGGEEGVWGEIHEGLVGFLIFLAVVHLCGVAASSWAHKENLILAMITGKK